MSVLGAAPDIGSEAGEGLENRSLHSITTDRVVQYDEAGNRNEGPLVSRAGTGQAVF